MKTISDILKLSTEFLKSRNIDRARRIAEELIAHALRLKKMDLYLQFDRPIIEAELHTIRDFLKQCAKGEPLEYVLGEVEFFGCLIKVDSRVLIPRQETEILVDMISKRIQGKGVLWDVCTGSGCIGIALKKKYPELEVTLSDLSEEALCVAKENAKINGVDVNFVQGNLLAPFQGKKADYIVCNPPYIATHEFAHLDAGVRDFEPKMALVGGETGLEMYEALARELPEFLQCGAQVFFEIGSSQKEALKKIFPKGEFHFDWAGHPRFLFS